MRNGGGSLLLETPLNYLVIARHIRSGQIPLALELGADCRLSQSAFLFRMQSRNRGKQQGNRGLSVKRGARDDHRRPKKPEYVLCFHASPYCEPLTHPGFPAE